MSVLFDAPVHLILLLAAVVAGQEPPQSVSPQPASATAGGQGVYAIPETIWLAAVREGFGGEAMDGYRSRIFMTSGGRLYVPVQSEKRAIMAARENATIAQVVTRDLARHHATELAKQLGRKASVKDLYAAHLFGLDLAARIAGLRARAPNMRVAAALPEIAAAYPELATGRGPALTVAQFYQRLPGGGADADDASQRVAQAPMLKTIKEPMIKEPNAGAQTMNARAPLGRLAAVGWTTQVVRAP